MKKIPQNLIIANEAESKSKFWEMVFDFLQDFEYAYGDDSHYIQEKYSINEDTYWEYSSVLPSLASSVCASITGYSDGSDFWEEVSDNHPKTLKENCNKELFEIVMKLNKNDINDMLEVKNVFGDFISEKLDNGPIIVHPDDNLKFKEILKHWFSYDLDIQDFFKLPQFQSYVLAYAVKYHG